MEKYIEIKGMDNLLEVFKNLKKENKEFIFHYICGNCHDTQVTDIFEPDDIDLFTEGLNNNQSLWVSYPCTNCDRVTYFIEIDYITHIEIM